MYDNFIDIMIDGETKEAVLVLDFQIDDDKNVLIYLNKNELYMDSMILRYAYYNVVAGVYHLTAIDESDRNIVNNVVINLIDELKNKNLNQ